MKITFLGKRISGGYSKRVVTLLLGAVLAIMLIAIARSEGIASYEQDLDVQIVQVDDRDNIQKLTDNFALAYRELQEAETAHTATAQTLDDATVAYNEAAEYLQTYTR